MKEQVCTDIWKADNYPYSRFMNMSRLHLRKMIQDLREHLEFKAQILSDNSRQKIKFS